MLLRAKTGKYIIPPITNKVIPFQNESSIPLFTNISRIPHTTNRKYANSKLKTYSFPTFILVVLNTF